MNYNFASTREPKNLYEILIKAAKINAERKLDKKLILLIVKKKIPSLHFMFFFFINLLLGKIFSQKKYVKIRYKECSLGRHALATTLSHPEVYFNKIKLFYYMIKYFIYAGSVIETAHEIKNNILAAYIDHGAYLNGLYFEVFSKKKIYLYSNSYPKGFYYLKPNNKITFEKTIQIKTKISLSNAFKKNLIKVISKNIKNPAKVLPWMQLTKFKIYKSTDFKNFDTVVLAQSFTDAQYHFGYDGFLNLEHWLDYTLTKLSILKKKIIVKSHPNFYDYQILPKKYTYTYAKLSYYDHMIYLRIKKRFEKYKNILFIDEPIKLYDFLLKLDNKSQIIITHHSTASLEAVSMGFKCISSSATIYNKKFMLTNSYDDISDYNLILKKSFKNLKLMNKSDFLNVYYQIFMNPFGVAGDKFFMKILNKTLNVNFITKFGYKNDFHKKMKNTYKKNISIEKLSNNIEYISI